MSFFSRIWWCKDADPVPDPNFVMVLGDKPEDQDDNKIAKYGWSNEKLSTPIRTWLREYLFAPDSKPLGKIKKTKSKRRRDKSNTEEDKEKDSEYSNEQESDQETKEKEDFYFKKKDSIYKYFDTNSVLK